MASPYMNPGSYLTERNRYANMLLQQDAQNPVRTHGQGLASLLRHAMAGWEMGEDKREREGASEAILAAMNTGQAPPGSPAAGSRAASGIPDQTTRQRLAQALTENTGNPYMARMAIPFAMADMQRKEALAASELAYTRGLTAADTAYGRAKKLKQMEVDAKDTRTPAMKEYDRVIEGMSPDELAAFPDFDSWRKRPGVGKPYPDSVAAQRFREAALRAGFNYIPGSPATDGKPAVGPVLKPVTGGAADLAAKKKERGTEKLSENLGMMVSSYLKLEQLGGVVSDTNSPIENVWARLSSTPLGQGMGQMFGTQTASVRKSIMAVRPLMVQSIRQASGMSARSMDSNVELKFYLQAASDPEGDLISNLVAIDVLDRTYGLGGVLEKHLPPEVYERVRNQGAIAQQVRPIPDIVEIRSEADYEALPSGQDFLGMDGKIRTKP